MLQLPTPYNLPLSHNTFVTDDERMDDNRAKDAYSIAVARQK